MTALDHQAIPDAQGAQDFQAVTISATASVIAAILAKIAEQDVKIDDLVIFSGRNKVWDGPDPTFPRDDTFNDVAGRLQAALTDPESKASFRVYLQYPDGNRVEIFRQTAGRVVKDDYNLANDLRAAYALDAVEQFTPERGAQDFVIGYEEAQAMAQAQGFEIPGVPSAGDENSQLEPTSAEGVTVDQDPWLEETPSMVSGSVAPEQGQVREETGVAPSDALQTFDGQIIDAMVVPDSPLSYEDLTSPQQKNVAALNGVYGQIAELDRRAAAGITYLTDPNKNPEYKALLDKAATLQAELGDLARFAEIAPVPESAATEKEPVSDRSGFTAFSQIAASIPLAEETFEAAPEPVESFVVPNTEGESNVQPVSPVDLNETSILNAMSLGVINVTPVQVVQRDSATELLEDIQPSLLPLEKTATTPNKNEAFIMDGVRDVALDYGRDPFGRLTENAANLITAQELDRMPLYEDAYIPEVKSLEEYAGQTIDVQPTPEIQPFLQEVAALSTQINDLRGEMNVQLQSSVAASDAILSNVDGEPSLGRWADRIGGVSETKASNWTERLRNAAAVAVEFVQQAYESPVGQYIAEQSVAGADLVGEVIAEKAAADWKKTQDFASQNLDRLQGNAPNFAEIDNGVDSLIHYLGESEGDRGIASFEGYTFIKNGGEHGVVREADGSTVYKNGKYTDTAQKDDKEYLQRFGQVAKSAAPILEAMSKNTATPIRSSGSGAGAGA
jgi:hypothetical protein